MPTKAVALAPEQHDLVADASAGNALEVAAAGAVVSKGFSTGRLDRAEATFSPSYRPDRRKHRPLRPDTVAS